MSSDQRRACRLRVPEGQNEAVVKAKGREVAVRLINTSATGFLFTCAELQAQQGDILPLFTEGGCFEVRVAFVRPGDEGCECGVERLRELVDESAVHQTNWLHLVFPRYHNIGLVGTGGLAITAGLLIGLIVLGGISLADVHNAKQSFAPVVEVRQFANRVAENLQHAISSFSPAPGTAPKVPAVAAEPSMAVVLLNRWQQDGGRQLAADLELTEQQLKQLGGLLTSVEMAGSDNADKSASVESRLEEILTDEQRAKIEANSSVKPIPR